MINNYINDDVLVCIKLNLDSILFLLIQFVQLEYTSKFLANYRKRRGEKNV